MRLIQTFLPSLLLISTLSLAQDTTPKDGRYYETEARKAYQQKNYPVFLEDMKRATELRPNHPRLMYSLAVAYCLNGNPNEALQWLNKLAAMGLVFPAEKDPDLASLRETSEFKTIQRRLESNSAPKVSSIAAFTVHEKGLVPESVAYDTETGIFYLSSVYKRKILRITSKGEEQVFADESSGLWSVMGMKVDAPRRVLWVCTAAHPQMAHYQAEDNGSSGIFKFDLRTGALLQKFLIADRSKPHWLGDLALNAAGDVFATDSVTPAIYVVRRDAQKLEQFFVGDPFVSPQGLDFSPDQKHLFVADYARGIFVVELATKRITSLTSAFTLLGIDGLYFHKGNLLGVQNGVNPERLVLLSLNRELTRVDHYETIEANNPVFDEPTLGVLVKDDFYFIANSQWGAIDATGHLAAEDKLKDPTVLRLKL